MITAETLVAREVHYCVSSLVATMAQAYGIDDYKGRSSDLSNAGEQAMELCSPILDYAQAAVDAGWKRDADNVLRHPDGCEGTTWESVCDHYGIEPYEIEVFEHWIVSDWLADHLIKRGEKVDKDFCGLTVWARTTTGQAIANDYVIDDILRELGEA